MARGEGPAAALDRAPDGVGQYPSGPPTGTGASGNPGLFRHYDGAEPAFQGSGAVVPRVGRSAGLVAAAFQQPNPDAEQDAIDFMSRPTVNYSKINRLLASPLMETSQKGQILFVEKERADPVLRRLGNEKRRYTELNIVALNWYLASTAKMPASPADVEPASSVLDTWAFEGVVATEEGKTELIHHMESGMERVFNSTVRGPVSTHNVFGDNVKTGTKLFAIVKKKTVDMALGFRVNPFTAVPLPVSGEARSHMPFQVSFFGDANYDEPPLSELLYHDEFGNPHYGAFTRIAIAANVPSMVIDPTHIERSTQDFGSVIALPKFEILVSQAW